MCDDVLNSKNLEEAKRVSKLIVSVFRSSISDIHNGLDNYGVSFGGKTVDHLGDIKMLKYKLEFFIDTDGGLSTNKSVDKSITLNNSIHGSGNSANTNNNTNINTVDIKGRAV